MAEQKKVNKPAIVILIIVVIVAIFFIIKESKSMVHPTPSFKPPAGMKPLSKAQMKKLGLIK